MTDHLTEAVRRLRQLQEDVERLKSGGDQGQVRELRRVDDATTATDSATVGPDADVDDGTVTADAVNSRLNDAETTDGVSSNDAVNSRLNDAETTDGVSSNDAAIVSNLQTASPAVCDFDNADKSDAG